MNIKNIFISSSFLAAIAIPLDKKDVWTELSFKKIQSNKVEYSPTGIKVSVNNSASPLVYKLDRFYKITGFEVDLKVDGDLKNEPYGKTIEEDSLFRLGLVVEGKQTLSGVKKLFAPDWIKKLFSLAPEGAGLDKIYFFNVGRSTESLSVKRNHPKTDLMVEEIIVVRKKTEPALKIKYQLAIPLNVPALWISIDGDNSKSTYVTTIEKLTLLTAE